MEADYFVISHAAAELGIPTSTLRRYCDMNVIETKRASDGSRLFSPAALVAAKAWLRQRGKKDGKRPTGHGLA